MGPHGGPVRRAIAVTQACQSGFFNMDVKPAASKVDVTKSALVPVNRLLRPASIAIVGISPEVASFGATMLSSLGSFDYRGSIHLVSRSRNEVLGRPCASSIDDLPMDI